MQLLLEEINGLADRLAVDQPPPGSIEARVLSKLLQIAALAQASPDSAAILSRFEDLRHYWTTAVPWCAQLSKDLEKILILHAELLEAAGPHLQNT